MENTTETIDISAVREGATIPLLDISPTWEQILPAILRLMRDGDEAGQTFALNELYRMARLADEFKTFLEKRNA